MQLYIFRCDEVVLDLPFLLNLANELIVEFGMWFSIFVF